MYNQFLTHHCFCFLHSLLGQGYKLEQLIDAAEETKKIRASRRANMKGSWSKFRSLYESATGTFRKQSTTSSRKQNKGPKPLPKIVAAKSG
jgi:hypothetical protein